MKKNTPIAFYLLLALLAGGILLSCSTDETCRKNTYVRFYADFYKIITENKKRTIKAGIDSVTVVGIGSDLKLYDSEKSVNELQLPLHKTDGVTRFSIAFNDTIDTLTIKHVNYDKYLSLECGCIKTATVDTTYITRHFIDSIAITSHEVNTNNAPNIKIYRHY